MGYTERKVDALIALHVLFLPLVLNHFQGNLLGSQVIARMLS